MCDELKRGAELARQKLAHVRLRLFTAQIAPPRDHAKSASTTQARVLCHATAARECGG